MIGSKGSGSRGGVGRVLAAALLAAAAGGCGGKPAGGPGGGPFAAKVKVSESVRQAVDEKIPLVASISANESVEVQSEINGAVDVVNFEEGQAVTNGQLLIHLDTRKLEAVVAEAEAGYALADANRARAQSMLANRTIAAQEYDQAEAAFASRKAMLDLSRRQLRDASISAPFSGIAGSRRVSPGQVVAPGVVLTTLVDIEPVKVAFRVPERFLGELRVGQAIAFHVPAYAGEEFRGEVYFIDPQVDVDTRTVLVKALQPNADGRLRPGMFGNLDLILHTKPDAVVVPENALLNQGDQAYVFIVDTNHTAKQVAVTVGTRMPGKVEITQGLAGGERVIVEGIQKVQPGIPVMTDSDVEAAAAKRAAP